jgi:serine/threonine protein kinase/TPR repeat protein
MSQWFRRKIQKRKRMKTCPQCSTGYPDSHTTCPIHGVPLNEIRDLKPGMVIRNTYRIIRKLGQGGMGAVYLAQHTLMDEPQALKFLSSELSQDEAFTARFLREVRTLRQIRHKNVVDAGNLEPSEDGTLFFSMEFVDGPDLRAFLRDAQSHSAEDQAAWKGWVPPVPRHPDQAAASWVPPVPRHPDQVAASWVPPVPSIWGPGIPPLSPAGSLPVPLALSITRQIAEGLGAAHSKGMVHRDIKPENILMARDAGAWLPKIADFGIVATKESSTVYTRTGGTLLTMAYAAPEQWRGTPAASLDGRTDLYALGGLLYEMLTGQTPFHAENYEGWSCQHQATPPQPPSTLRPDLANWQGLGSLTLRLLAKDRNDRPANVAELVELIDAVRHLPSDVRQETVKEDGKQVGGKHTRRFPIWVWAAFAVVLLAAASGVWYFFGLSGSNRSTEQPDKKTDIASIEKQAEALESQKGYSAAVPLFNQACAGGKSDSCDHLGKIYQLGGIGANDYLMAAAYFTKACDAGNSYGCYDLGGMYEFGEGVALDHAKAATLWSKACDAGNTDSCNDLGNLYYDGKGVKRDYRHAFALFSKACDSGRPMGCGNLGIMYLEGRGVAKDIAKARSFFKKGCDIGFKESCDEGKKLQ